MDIADLEVFLEAENRRLVETLDGLTRENIPLAQTVKLSEEVGEVCRAVLAAEDLQRDRNEEGAQDVGPEGAQDVGPEGAQDVGQEVADVVITSLLLAKTLEIDIEAALERKIARIEDRY
ncbi:MAG: MazG nucleotide pyrophosphohydrolase domain-containing protein [Halodesulfurarchaeum sp.]